MPEEEGNADKKPGFLKSVVSAFGLVTAWVFVVGWAYLHAYYAYFGVNVDSLDFPAYHYLIFCYTQFVTFSWSGVGIAAVLFAFFLITWAGTQTVRKAWAVLISCTYLFMFWAGFHLAVRNGKNAAVHNMGLRSPLPLITLELAKEKKKEIQDGATEEALGSSDLRLLLETKEQLFVFVPVDTTSQSVRVSVLAIDRQETPLSMRVVTVR
jgi:hypothetical protein